MNSVRNKVSPPDNDWLKLPWTNLFENLSDKFTLKQMGKRAVQFKKIMVWSDWFQNLFRTLHEWTTVSCTPKN